MGSYAGIVVTLNLKPWNKLSSKMSLVALTLKLKQENGNQQTMTPLKAFNLDERMFDGFSSDTPFNWDARGHHFEETDDGISLSNVVVCRSGYVKRWIELLEECSWDNQFVLPDKPTVIFEALYETPTQYAHTRLTLMPCGFITNETYPVSNFTAQNAINTTGTFSPLVYPNDFKIDGSFGLWPGDTKVAIEVPERSE